MESLPEWIKESNNNIPKNITDTEEIMLSTNLLDQLHSSIPNASLRARVWKKKNSLTNSQKLRKSYRKSKTMQDPSKDSKNVQQEIDLVLAQFKIPKNEASSLKDPMMSTSTPNLQESEEEFVFDDHDDPDDSDDDKSSAGAKPINKYAITPSPVIPPK